MSESSLSAEQPDYVYVRERGALETLVERMGHAETIALDTEADSLHNYFEKVCLIQLSLRGEHYLVDPLAGLELSGFLAALAEKPLIVHGGDYDLRMLRASTGFRPRSEVFDTMLAAQLLGFEQIGLAALIERFFAVVIGKEGQKSDWSRRPLSERQMRYAVNDTLYLESLASRLAGMLKEKGRSAWHQESCRAMVESTGRESGRDPDEAWRIKGSGRLTRRQLAYLRELWRWRDEHARRGNVPAFKIFGNQEIMTLLEWAESHPGEALHQGPKLPRNIIGVLSTTLQAALLRSAAVKPAHWPERKRGDPHEASSDDCKEEIAALRGECARIAGGLEIAASTLAPRAALEAIVRRRPRTVEAIMASGGLLRWQAEIVHAAVEKTLHGSVDSVPPAR
jgi:ribonuclease D